LRKEEVVIRIKVLVRLAEGKPLEIRHPAVIREALRLRSQEEHNRIIGPKRIERRLGNSRVRSPGETRNREEQKQQQAFKGAQAF
jgi:hypothetical protein